MNLAQPILILRTVYIHFGTSHAKQIFPAYYWRISTILGRQWEPRIFVALGTIMYYVQRKGMLCGYRGYLNSEMICSRLLNVQFFVMKVRI